MTSDPVHELRAHPSAEWTDDLRDSLLALTTLEVKALPLEELLTAVARFAVQAISGAEGAGLMLLEHGRARTVVSTARFVQQIEEAQYSLGEGPCLRAAFEGHPVRSDSLGGDDRWPRFGGRVARLGVHSVLSLPLIAGGEVLGAMNVYAHDRAVFDDDSVVLGEMYAVPAAIAVQNAHVLAETRRVTEHLESALANRRIVDQALGIMMSRSGDTADEALIRLQRRSQCEHLKLLDLAQDIVEETIRRWIRTRSHQSEL